MPTLRAVNRARIDASPNGRVLIHFNKGNIPLGRHSRSGRCAHSGIGTGTGTYCRCPEPPWQEYRGCGWCLGRLRHCSLRSRSRPSGVDVQVMSVLAPELSINSSR